MKKKPTSLKHQQAVPTLNANTNEGDDNSISKKKSFIPDDSVFSENEEEQQLLNAEVSPPPKEAP